MQRIDSEYARALHLHLRRVGHLWQARFHSVAMDDQHFRAGMVYVERNPLRAGLVEKVEDWRWSSARAHLGLADPGLLDLVGWRREFDVSRWKRYLEAGLNEAYWEDRIREATLSGKPVGTEEFVESVRARLTEAKATHERAIPA